MSVGRPGNGKLGGGTSDCTGGKTNGDWPEMGMKQSHVKKNLILLNCFMHTNQSLE